MGHENKRILIQKIEKLSTISPALSRIISLADSDASSSAQLSEAVSKDPSISSMILRLVNSAFYGHMRGISTISRAVVILGFQTVKTMAMGVSLFHTPSHNAPQLIDRERLWLHSLSAGAFSKNLFLRSRNKGTIDDETAFLVGLLHDIGKVVFDSYFLEDHHKALQNSLDQKISVTESETHIMGITHEEAGAILAHRWKFPLVVERAIGTHHHIGRTTNKEEPAIALAHLADHCSHAIGFDYWDGDQREVYDPAALAICGLTQKDVSDALHDIEQERQAIEGLVMRS